MYILIGGHERAKKFFFTSQCQGFFFKSMPKGDAFWGFHRWSLSIFIVFLKKFVQFLSCKIPQILIPLKNLKWKNKLSRYVVKTVLKKYKDKFFLNTDSWPPNHICTSLMADLRQDINRFPSFSRCLNGTFPCRNCSIIRHWYINPNDKSNKYKSSLLS